MEILDLPLAGLKLIRPRVFSDSRGYFLETYHQQRIANFDFGQRFVQDNLSFSTRGVLRGLHYQYPTWQGKLVVTCFDLVTGPQMVNTKHEMPATLSELEPY